MIVVRQNVKLKCMCDMRIEETRPGRMSLTLRQTNKSGHKRCMPFRRILRRAHAIGLKTNGKSHNQYRSPITYKWLH